MITTGIKLTLYKNCILNDGYKNVFSQVKASALENSVFENYLISLEKLEYEIDEVYQEDNTVFNFYLKSTDYTSIYLFNYLKIESYIDGELVLTRFAFIDKIKIMNELAQITYKLDIWHSFSQNIQGINKSFLKGLRIINGTGNIIIPSYISLPIDYEGNNKLTLPTLEYGINDYCVIIAEIQFYLGVKLGDISFAETKYVLIDRTALADTGLIKFKDVYNVINELCLAAQIKNSYDGSSDACYFTIGNLFILPSISNLTSKFLSANQNQRFDYKDIGGNIFTACYFRELDTSFANYDFTSPFELKSYTFQNNFKTKSIGNFSRRVEVIPNGSTISADLLCSVRKDCFKIFLNIENKFLDITKDFYYEPLTTYVSGDVIAQQRMSRTLKSVELDERYLKRILGDTMGGISDTGSLIKSGKSGNQFSMISSASSLAQNVGNLEIDIAAYSVKRKALNSPIYNNSQIVAANDISVLNARALIFSLNIDSDNDNYVKESINNMGYNVYEYTSSITETGIFALPTNFISHNIYYNVIQFGISDVFGYFPLSIANKLNEILKNGIKIWYHHNIAYALQNDDYAVG